MPQISRRNILLSAVGAGILGTGARFVGETLPIFGGHPEGARLERMKTLPYYHDGAFHNTHPGVIVDTGKSGMRRMGEFFLDNSSGQKPIRPIPNVRQNLSGVRDGEYIWLGHSGVFLRLEGKTLLIDPSVNQAFLFPGFFEPFPGSTPFSPKDFPLIDVLIITHDHYDHLDYRTVLALKDRVKSVICPLGVGAHFERWGYDPNRVRELVWEESVQISEALYLTALPAHHFSGRSTRRNETLWSSFMIEAAGFRIFHSGDSGYSDHFHRIREIFPRIDFAFIEDGQYNDDWSEVHMRPSDHIKALSILQPGTVAAVHNSKFDLSRHRWTDPLNNAMNFSNKTGIPLVTSLIGQTVSFGNPAPIGKPWWPDTP